MNQAIDYLEQQAATLLRESRYFKPAFRRINREKAAEILSIVNALKS